MKVLLPISTVLLLVTASCESTPWRTRDTVDDAYLARVSSDERQEIAELRSSRAEMNDELAFAERRIDEEQARKKVAESEVDIAKQEVSRAKAQIDATEKRGGDLSGPREDLDVANAHVRWAEAQVSYHNMRITHARSERELAMKRVALAEARVELRKAKAIAELEDDAIPDIELAAYEKNVEDAEMEVELAEIDLEALSRKVDARQALVDRRAESTPENRRASWQKTDAVEAGSKRSKQQKDKNKDKDY